MDIDNPLEQINMTENTSRFSSIKTGIKDKSALIKVIGLILLVILLIIAAAIVIRDRSQKGGADKLNAEALYEVNSDSVVDLVPFPNGVVVLTSNAVEYVDVFGNLMNSNDHSFANPVAVTAGKNLLVYDLGGVGIRIEKNSAKFKPIECRSPISCADITSNGTYAYVLNADEGHQSHLYAYSYKGKLLFEWGSADYVIAVALSPNGKYAAVSLLTVDNAQTVCKVIFFNFGKDEPIFTAEYSGETIYDLEFISSNKLALFSEKGVYLLNGNGEQQTLSEFSSNELNHSAVCKSGLGVSSIGLYGNNSNALVRIYTNGFKNVYEHTFTEAVNGVSASSSAAAVVSGSEIHIFNANDRETGKVVLKDMCIDSVISGKRLYVLTSNGLFNYNLNDTYED